MGWTVWTADDDANLTQWAKNGLSASEIAAEFGHKYTRNAVIGRMKRLRDRGTNLTTKVQQFWNSTRNAELRRLYPENSVELIATLMKVSAKAVYNQASRLKLNRERSKAVSRPIRVRFARPYRARQEAVASIGVSFLDLANDQCRYVLGEVDGIQTMFCGSPVEAEQSYCSLHCAVCFTPRG